MACPYFDPEYENLNLKINPPRVTIDNSSDTICTVVKVDSQNRHGILLELVQILSDLNLSIRKAYICSDGGWFMDVFHVTDQQGKKITDTKTFELEKSLGPQSYNKKKPRHHHTTVELIGKDRPGLLSEISAVLAGLRINVVAAEAWTHNNRIACVLYVNDDDVAKLSLMEQQLKSLTARTNLSMGFTHTDRRLHQMLFADRDYEENPVPDVGPSPVKVKPLVTIEHCADKDYSVLNVRCQDRAKLMFDIVCTLTDMQYVVFHAAITSDGPIASQEYFIRHIDGCTLDTEGERKRVVKCIEAALHRRVSEGISFELCGKDRVGLLSEVTRILRENGLCVRRAGVSTVGEEAMNVFYVRDACGRSIDTKTIEAIRNEIGQTAMLNVKSAPVTDVPARGRGKTGLFFGNLFDKLLG